MKAVASNVQRTGFVDLRKNPVGPSFRTSSAMLRNDGSCATVRSREVVRPLSVKRLIQNGPGQRNRSRETHMLG